MPTKAQLVEENRSLRSEVLEVNRAAQVVRRRFADLKRDVASFLDGRIDRQALLRRFVRMHGGDD